MDKQKVALLLLMLLAGPAFARSSSTRYILVKSSAPDNADGIIYAREPNTLYISRQDRPWPANITPNLNGTCLDTSYSMIYWFSRYEVEKSSGASKLNKICIEKGLWK